MKQVKRLKTQHTDRFWIDSEGDLWYWDSDFAQWIVMMPVAEGGYTPETCYNVDDYGPFAPIHSSFPA